jgi:hypothetical protein
MAILHIFGLKRWKREWKQTREFVVTAATEVLDPGVGSGGIILVPVWILKIACLKQQGFF